jgi:NADH-quinone oxidoreductase subunit J
VTTLLPLAATTTGAEVGASTGDAVLFWTLGPLMVIAALGLIFARKAVHAALSMAVVMVSLGGVYVGLQAPFLGMVQVFVYTGAVMMLFLFVLMLVGVDSSDSLVETIRGQRLAALLAAGGFTVFVVVALGRTAWPTPVGLDEVNEAGNITGIAELIFSRYVWAFELTAALLVVAAIGAMVLAHRERTGERPTQRSISEERLRRGQRMTPLPPPGTFARHNAVDTPALLPDGSPSELSVSRVLQARGQTMQTQGLVDDVPAIVSEVDPEGRGTRTGGSAVGGHPIDPDPARHGEGPLGEDAATGDASDGTSDSSATREA